jgi:deazaflavin-dependent oxidoreductase (nitroreductase family)
MTEDNYTPPDLALVGEEHVRRYFETNGEVGHDWNGVPALVLTTIGRKSGEERHSALIYGRLGNDYVVVASMAGAPTHPAWFLNLTADPNVVVQVGAERFAAVARTVEGVERANSWSEMLRIWPNYEVYQSRTDRVIPVVLLKRAQYQ